MNTFKLDELVGYLLTYEMTLKYENEKEDIKKENTKKKGIALKYII